MSSQFSAEFKEYNYLHSEIGSLYHEVAQKVGLSDSVMSILYTVTTYGTECTQSNICRLTGISRQTINSAIRKLEQEGILYLEENGRKNKAIRLTPRGQALVDEKVMPMMAAEKAVLESWPEEDRQTLLRLTRRYLENFRHNLEETEK